MVKSETGADLRMGKEGERGFLKPGGGIYPLSKAPPPFDDENLLQFARKVAFVDNENSFFL